MNIYFIFLNLALAFASKVKLNFVQDLLSASEHETQLTEELAELLEIEYDRRGLCDNGVTSTCCDSCAHDGTCYYGGYCCESSKILTKMLKLGENQCPNSWESDCKLTKMIPIKGCNSETKPNHRNSYEHGASSDSSSSEDRSGLRLMCLCLQTRRCCSGAIAPTTPITADTDANTVTAATTSSTARITTSTATSIARTSIARTSIARTSTSTTSITSPTPITSPIPAPTTSTARTTARTTISTARTTTSTAPDTTPASATTAWWWYQTTGSTYFIGK